MVRDLAFAARQLERIAGSLAVMAERAERRVAPEQETATQVEGKPIPNCPVCCLHVEWEDGSIVSKCRHVIRTLAAAAPAHDALAVTAETICAEPEMGRFITPDVLPNPIPSKNRKAAPNAVLKTHDPFCAWWDKNKTDRIRNFDLYTAGQAFQAGWEAAQAERELLPESKG